MKYVLPVNLRSFVTALGMGRTILEQFTLYLVCTLSFTVAPSWCFYRLPILCHVNTEDICLCKELLAYARLYPSWSFFCFNASFSFSRFLFSSFMSHFLSFFCAHCCSVGVCLFPLRVLGKLLVGLLSARCFCLGRASDCTYTGWWMSLGGLVYFAHVWLTLSHNGWGVWLFALANASSGIMAEV